MIASGDVHVVTLHMPFAQDFISWKYPSRQALDGIPSDLGLVMKFRLLNFHVGLHICISVNINIAERVVKMYTHTAAYQCILGPIFNIDERHSRNEQRKLIWRENVKAPLRNYLAV